MRRTQAFLAFLAVMLLISGCGPKSLRSRSVDHLQFVSVGDLKSPVPFCQGRPEPIGLKVDAVFSDGTVRSSVGPGQYPIADLELTVDGGQWLLAPDHTILLLPSANALDTLDRDVVLTARLAGRHDVSTSFSMRPRYDCTAVLDVSGAPGAPGAWGGTAGTPRHGGPVQGESAINALSEQPGQGGDDGAPGADGQAAPSSVVKVAVVDTPRGRIALADVDDAEGRHHVVAFDPAAGQLIVDAVGGAGGRGGDGGNGGNGANGSTAQAFDTAGDGGNGGDGGHGGRGGNGGNGGAVTLVLDVSIADLHDRIHVRNEGGAGGAPGLGGLGGRGGEAGPAIANTFAGHPGRPGQAGSAGVVGDAGHAGAASQWAFEPAIEQQLAKLVPAPRAP